MKMRGLAVLMAALALGLVIAGPAAASPTVHDGAVLAKVVPTTPQQQVCDSGGCTMPTVGARDEGWRFTKTLQVAVMGTVQQADSGGSGGDAVWVAYNSWPMSAQHVAATAEVAENGMGANANQEQAPNTAGNTTNLGAVMLGG